MNNFQEELYRQKYLKYKEKYLAAKQLAGNPIEESELRPGEGQEIGLVTGVEHPYYDVTNYHGTYRVKLRAGINHKLKKDGTQKEHKIEKNVTFVLIHPEVCDYGQGKCGDILKIYSSKEKKYLLDNQTRLIRKGFITERLYEGSHYDQSSQGAHAVQFVDTAPIVKSSNSYNLEMPSSDEESDDETMAIARRHQAPEHNFGHQADDHHQSHGHQEGMPKKKSSGRAGKEEPVEVEFFDKHRQVLPPPESHHMEESRSHSWGKSSSQSWGPSRHHQMSSHSVHSGEGTLVSRASDGSWTANILLSGKREDVMIPQRVIQSDFGRRSIHEGKRVRVTCYLDNGKYIATRVE